MKYKGLFIFEISKIFIAILNIIFLVEQYPELSLFISLISIITSVAGAGVLAGAVAVVVAGAVAVVVVVARIEEEDIKPKRIKRCSKCKQEIEN